MQIVLASVQMDPFVSQEEAFYGEDLLVHYATPIVDGDDVFIEVKSGAFRAGNWSTQSWGVQALRWQGGRLVARWTTMSDWKPVPQATGCPSFEPVFQPVLANGFVYMPGAGGSVLRINRDTGASDRVVSASDSATFVTGPLVADAEGNIYYNEVILDATDNPWLSDIRGASLIRIGTDGSV